MIAYECKRTSISELDPIDAASINKFTLINTYVLFRSRIFIVMFIRDSE